MLEKEEIIKETDVTKNDDVEKNYVIDKPTLQMSRRRFVQMAGAATAALTLGSRLGIDLMPEASAFSQSQNLTKFIQALRNPLAGGIPLATADTLPAPVTGVKHYTIDISEFKDTLHPGLGPTTLRGYNPAPDGVPNTNQTHLGGIIVAQKGVPIQITFRNKLSGNHPIPVDQTIMGADLGPNRVDTHLHGGFVPWISDGGPHAWFDPNGNYGASVPKSFYQILNPSILDGQAEYYYPNNQSARLVWYHDHAWGITRMNAYAGIASAYVITDSYETNLALNPVNLPGPTDPRTLYLVFQDKIFVDSTTIGTLDPTWTGPRTTGSLWYAHVYDPKRWMLGPAINTPLPDPSIIPEFFGDTMLVNGTVFPYLEVQQREYRFRMLNACQARFLNPRLVYAQSNIIGSVGSTEPSANVAGPAFVQIGSEGGFLPAPAMVNGPKQPLLLMGPAERSDLIVDFRAVPVGSILILYNDAPAPFPKGSALNDYYPQNPKTPTSIAGSGPNTRTLLQIRVTGPGPVPADPSIALPTTLTPSDPFLLTQTAGVPNAYTIDPVTGKASLTLANGTTVTANIRYLTLNETFDNYGRLIQFLGTNQPVNVLVKPPLFGRDYMSTATEVVSAGSYEIWEIANLTADVHPIHFHLVNVHVLSRQAFSMKQYAGGIPNYQGPVIAPDPNELGWKETVRMNPGEVTRVFMKFDLPVVPFTVPTSPRTGGNEYVWHCHILEHEEHDMMRPLVVL